MSVTSSLSKPRASRDLIGVVNVVVKPCTEHDTQRYGELQKLRRKYDHAFQRWLPHITLIPPFTLPGPSEKGESEFLGENSLDELGQNYDAKLSLIAQTAAKVCKDHESHSLLLDEVSTFHSRKRTNVHLRPFPTNFQDKDAQSKQPKVSNRGTTQGRDGDHSSRRIVKLQKSLADKLGPLLHPEAAGEEEAVSEHHGGKQAKGGQASDKTRGRSAFKPHVSVGHSIGADATWQLCRNAENALKLEGHGSEQTAGQSVGLLCKVDHIQLRIRQKGLKGACQFHSEIRLGSGIGSAVHDLGIEDE